MSMSLGQRIVYYRKKAGFSRKRLAEIIGVSYEALRNYKKDLREPNVTTLTNLARALNITSDALLGLEPHPQSLTAQNTDESTLLRFFRSFNNIWRDRILAHISWLSEMSASSSSAHTTSRSAPVIKKHPHTWRYQKITIMGAHSIPNSPIIFANVAAGDFLPETGNRPCAACARHRLWSMR